MINRTPFSFYTIDVDLDAEEVIVEATDEDSPMETYHGRFSLEELLPLLRRLNSALKRY